MTLFEWQAPGPYRVAFSTRLGGVSAGAFASLNLGVYTDDEPTNVHENRKRLCGRVGVDPETATMAWQYHSAVVAKADGRGVVTPGLEFERCDGLWTDEPGVRQFDVKTGATVIKFDAHEGTSSARE